MMEHDVIVNHHAWMNEGWEIFPLYRARSFFPVTSGFAS